MSFQLVIAEKPSVARSIAAVIGATEKQTGYWQCGIRYRRFGREARQRIRCLPGQKQRKRIRRSRIRIRDREQKEGRQNRRSRELRKIKRMELKKMKLKKMEWKSRSRSRRKQESQNRQPESRHQRQNPKRRSLSRRRPSKPAAHRVRFSTRRPTRFRRQFPLTFLLTRRRS